MPLTEQTIATENKVLSSLNEDDLSRLRSKLEPVNLSTNEVLKDIGEPIQFLYFPNDVVLSCLSSMEDGTTVEVCMVGREGVIGIPAVLGAPSTPYRVIAQVPGNALRLRTSAMKDEFERCGPLHNVLLRYTYFQLVQAAQTAACNQLHTVEERLCRWLLNLHDKVKSDDLQVTQEFISRMLGTRRSGITVAAGSLQKKGFIKYSRGKIKILDRDGLETASCECYGILRQEYNRVLSS
jgi:CRP-like cAMP-binding protein